MAPVGVQTIFHEDKETGLAEVCGDIGVPYILSTASSSTIEEVAAASKGPRWFQ
jgi:lactate 2-monooxygenase